MSDSIWRDILSHKVCSAFWKAWSLPVLSLGHGSTNLCLSAQQMLEAGLYCLTISRSYADFYFKHKSKDFVGNPTIDG